MKKIFGNYACWSTDVGTLGLARKQYRDWKIGFYMGGLICTLGLVANIALQVAALKARARA